MNRCKALGCRTKSIWTVTVHEIVKVDLCADHAHPVYHQLKQLELRGLPTDTAELPTLKPATQRAIDHAEQRTKSAQRARGKIARPSNQEMVDITGSRT